MWNLGEIGKFNISGTRGAPLIEYTPLEEKSILGK